MGERTDYERMRDSADAHERYHDRPDPIPADQAREYADIVYRPDPIPAEAEREAFMAGWTSGYLSTVAPADAKAEAQRAWEERRDG